MKMVKLLLIMVLTLVGMGGLPSVLYATTGTFESPTLTPEEKAANLATAQANYISRLKNTLNATTWDNYLTINGAGYHTRDVLYGAITVTTLPDPAAVWEAVYNSLKHGAALAFLAVTGNTPPPPGDIIMLQTRLTEAKSSHADDSRLNEIQYVLHLVFLRIATNAGTLADFWQDIKYGAPSSPSDTTIFDLVMNNLPGSGYSIETTQTNPQDIFARALIHGIDLVTAANDLQKLTSLQSYFTTAQSKYSTMFAGYPGTQEKFYCGFLTSAGASASSFENFWTVLSTGTPSGINIFDMVLGQAYTPQNQQLLITSLTAAFNKGIELSTTLEDFNKLQNYLNLAQTKYSTANFSSAQQALDTKKALNAETALKAVTDTTPFNNIITLLQQTLALSNVPSPNTTNLANAFGEAWDTAIAFATFDQCDTLNSLLINPAHPVPTWLSSNVTLLQQAVTYRKEIITEKQLITDLTNAATATKLSDIIHLLTSANQITSFVVFNALSNFTTAYTNAFNHAISLAASAADITTLTGCLPPTTGLLSELRAPLYKSLVYKETLRLSDSYLLPKLYNVLPTTPFDDIVNFLTQALTYSIIGSPNTINLSNNFIKAFRIAVSIANLAQCDTLGSLLTASVPPWLSSSSVTLLQQAISTRKAELQPSHLRQYATRLSNVTSQTPIPNSASLIDHSIDSNFTTNSTTFWSNWNASIQGTLNETIDWIEGSTFDGIKLDISRTADSLVTALKQAAYYATLPEHFDTVRNYALRIKDLKTFDKVTPFSSIANFANNMMDIKDAINVQNNIYALKSAPDFATIQSAINNANNYTPTNSETNLPYISVVGASIRDALIRALTLSTNYGTIQSLITAVQTRYSSTDFSSVVQALETDLIAKLNAISTDAQFNDITTLLTQTLALSTVTSANATNLVNAFGEAFDTAANIATIAQCDNTLSPLLTNVPEWLNASLSLLQEAISARKAELQQTDTQTQLITDLTAAATATKLSDITPYLTSAAAITTPLPANAEALSTAFSDAFKHAVDLAANLTDINSLKPVLDTTQTITYLNSVWSTLNATWTQRQQQLQAAAAANAEQQFIIKLNAVTATTPFDEITTLLTQTLALSTATDNLVNAFGEAFDTAVSTATGAQCETLNSLITNVPEWLNESLTLLQETISTRKAELQKTDTETQLITDLTTAATATKLSDITTYLTSAAAITTPLPANADALSTAFSDVFKHAVDLAANLTDINTLKPVLDTTQTITYLNSVWSTLNATWTQRQQQLQAASDAAAAANAEQQFITKLNAVTTTTTFDEITTLLSQTLALSTVTDVNKDSLLNSFGEAFDTAVSAATVDQCETLNSLITNPAHPVPEWLSASITLLQQAIADRKTVLQKADTENQLITDLTAAATATRLSDITSYLTSAAAITTPLPANAEALSTAFSDAFKHAVALAANLADINTLKPVLDTTQTITYLNSVWSTLNTAWTQKQQQLQSATDAATKESQLITNLQTATTVAALLPLLATALAPTYTPVNATELASTVVTKFTATINAATSLSELTQLSTLLKTPPAYISSNATALGSALAQKQQQLQSATDAATKEVNLITNLKAATTFATLYPLLATALAPTYTPVNATELASTVVTKFTVAINAATSLSELTQLSDLLKTPPAYISSNATALSSPLAQKQQQLQSATDAATKESQLITNLQTATTVAALLPLLATALAPTYTPVNASELASTVVTKFTAAINAATSLSELTQLSDLLKTPPAYISSSVTALNSAITQKQLQLQSAIDAATKEANLITNLKAATTVATLYPLLATALAPTYTPVNATELASTVVTKFTVAINAATSLSELTQLSDLLKTPPAYISSNATALSSPLAQKQLQLQAATDAATKEADLITNLKAATTVATLYPLLATALAPTYTPVNATELTNTIVTKFTAAINAATSLSELTQLSTLLKTTPAYISSSVTALNSAITQKQQQIPNPTVTESTIITKLKSTQTTIDALFSCLDTILATNYQPINLTSLKTTVLTGLTRTITLITTSNYTTAQPKITGYISRATPKYITTTQNASLANSLKAKVSSTRASVISAFTTKITSFKSAATAALAIRTIPATVLAQRQSKLISTIQAASAIIDAHTQLAPSTTEISKIMSSYTSFNTSLIKLIQDQGFIKKTVSGKNTTYALAYNATAAEPKASLKKVLNFMSTAGFPYLTADQKNIIILINNSIV